VKRFAALLLLASLGACAGRPVAPGPATPPPPPGQPVVPPPPTVVDANVFALKGAPGQGALLYGTAPQGTALLLLDGKPVRFAASDGRFIIGFGRDAGPSALLEARLADGRLLRLPLAVAPRQWDISYLPTLKAGVSPAGPGPRRLAELAEIEAAKNRNSPADGWRGPFRWPAYGRISTLFGSQRIYAGGVKMAYHGGLDIARYPDGPVLDGTPARAPADGVVVLATTDRPFILEGNLVMIDHGFGLITALMHLSAIAVHVGDTVHAGQEIGRVGMTGRATGPHLHWGLTWNGERLDPLLLVGPMPARN
jgi:hypothetical protein